MRLACPQCNRIQEVLPSALLGKYFICEFCHAIVLWEKARQLYEDKINSKPAQNFGANHQPGGSKHPEK